MAMAVRSAQTNARKATVNWLIITMILGCVFLGVKVIEYQDKFANYEVPGASYDFGVSRAAPRGRRRRACGARRQAESIGS